MKVYSCSLLSPYLFYETLPREPGKSVFRTEALCLCLNPNFITSWSEAFRKLSYLLVLKLPHLQSEHHNSTNSMGSGEDPTAHCSPPKDGHGVLASEQEHCSPGCESKHRKYCKYQPAINSCLWCMLRRPLVTFCAPQCPDRAMETIIQPTSAALRTPCNNIYEAFNQHR